MITKVSSGRGGQMVYTFDNGNIVSFLWAWGSYSDNNINFLENSDITKNFKRSNWQSSTVEVYSMGKINSIFTKWLEDTYESNPAGYVPVADIPKILAHAESNDA